MTDGLDMSAPVTRGELRDELTLFKTELRQEFATKIELRDELALLKTELRQELATKVELRDAIAPLATKVELRDAIAPLATKVELELWGGALMARMDAQAEALRGQIDATRRELQADLARHANTIFESTQAMIRALDDKYADLPRRVSKLESSRARR